MSTAKPPNEADIIFNRANIALARSQRLVASWLPPRTTTTSEESNTSGLDDKQDDDDDEIFTAVPERFVSPPSLTIDNWWLRLMSVVCRLGLGAPVPVKDAFNTLNSSGGSSNKLDDKLRQRLLGRNAKKFMQQQQQQKQQAAQARGKTGQSDDVIAKGNKEIEDEDDEEEGRTSLGKKKHTQPKQRTKVETEKNEDTDDVNETNINDSTEPQIPTIPTIPSNKRKKTGKVSYLDELLQDRKKKKKKRVDWSDQTKIIAICFVPRKRSWMQKSIGIDRYTERLRQFECMNKKNEKDMWG